MNIASTAQMKEMDRIAIQERGIPSLELMENAASHVTEAALDFLKQISQPRVLVICSFGNNGGDGLACARQLRKAGIDAQTLMVGNREKQTRDSKVNEQRLLETGGSVQQYEKQDLPDCDLMIDAIFGVGLNREVSGTYRELMEKINRSGTPVIACDIPSGVNGDSGEVMGIAVKACRTVTFSCAKPGLLSAPGREYAGELSVVGIGIPDDLMKDILEN